MYEVVALNSLLPERKRSVELCSRENKACLQDGTYSVQLLKNIAVFQSSKTTITPHTSKLKSISKYQLLTPVLFEDL